MLAASWLKTAFPVYRDGGRFAINRRTFLKRAASQTRPLEVVPFAFARIDSGLDLTAEPVALTAPSVIFRLDTFPLHGFDGINHNNIGILAVVP